MIKCIFFLTLFSPEYEICNVWAPSVCSTGPGVPTFAQLILIQEKE